MKLIKQPPNDSFTKRLFYKLALEIKRPSNVIYMWSIAIDPGHNQHYITDNELFHRRELYDTINEDLVVIGIKDHLTTGWFNPFKETKPNLVLYLEDMFDFYKDKTFIVFTSLENLIFRNNNAHVVTWGGDITNQRREYQKLDPVLDKNFESNLSYINLNRNNRTHRILILSALYGLDLESSGFITCMFKHELSDNINNYEVPVTPIFEVGFNKLKEATFSAYDQYQIYPHYNNDNVFNFNHSLRNYYRNSFVEIISETSFTEPAFLLTEKTLNSIYGCNFPILLGGVGAVSFLRNMGFDMFDDIINHNYDTIQDPVEKIYCAINDNKDILNNVDLAKTLWKENEQRFKNNVDFAQKQMYEYYENRTVQQWRALGNLYDNVSR